MAEKQQEALLGLATTAELLDELRARAENFPHELWEPTLPMSVDFLLTELKKHMAALPGGLSYRTVDG